MIVKSDGPCVIAQDWVGDYVFLCRECHGYEPRRVRSRREAEDLFHSHTHMEDS